MLKGEYLPAPVTRATLSAKEAEARPSGPGMASYLETSRVVPGILVVIVVAVVERVAQSLILV